jgi:hypothetical protein
VPITGGARYADGKIGRSRWDVVQTINYCVRVLQGSEPEDNPRKITKAIAVILLAHLVGDIHQPLHVGAEFFDEQGRPVDPEKTQPAYDHHGGNTITFRFSPAAAERTGPEAGEVSRLLGQPGRRAQSALCPKQMPKEERRAITEEARAKLVAEMVANEPKAWRLASDLSRRSMPKRGQTNPAASRRSARAARVSRRATEAGRERPHACRRGCRREADAGRRAVPRMGGARHARELAQGRLAPGGPAREDVEMNPRSAALGAIIAARLRDHARCFDSARCRPTFRR